MSISETAVLTYRNFIGGEWVPATSGETFENRSPANQDDLIGLVPKSGPEDVDRAVKAARAAYASWRLVPAPKRAELLYRAAQILTERKEAYARDMTREMGKILDETRGDVQEAIDMSYLMAGEGRRMYGQTAPSELRDKFAMSLRQPIGVCGLITAWNFPIAVPSWKILPALVCGNTIVFKPAEEAPQSAVNFVQALADAGVPAGVLNLVLGDGPGAGAPLVSHPDVQVVSFTGSTEVGRLVNQACAPSFKKVHLEMGGKNVILVMEDAKLELAVEGALWGGFGTTGQRCTAASRVVVHEKVYKAFLEAFAARAKALRVGDGLKPETQMGPSVSESQLERVMSYVKIGQDEGARLATGGHRLSTADTQARVLPRADHLCGRGAEDADRARGDLRAGRVGGALHVTGRRHRHRQRRRLWPVGLDLHAGHQQGVRRDARRLHRPLLRERTDDWRRGASAVRRHQGHRQRPPRGRHRRARRLHRVEVGVRRLQRQAPARAD